MLQLILRDWILHCGTPDDSRTFMIIGILVLLVSPFIAAYWLIDKGVRLAAAYPAVAVPAIFLFGAGLLYLFA